MALFELARVSYEVLAMGQRRKLLIDIDLAIKAGELFTIIGPSGAGKSSLLYLLNRMHEVSSGEIRYNEQPLTSYEVTDLRRQVGMLLQKPFMLPGTVRANILAGPQLSSKRSTYAPEDLLSLVGLGPNLLGQEARSLSGGEQQRVSLARLLANQPQVLLLDEPTAALNQAAAEEIEALIQKLVVEQHLTVVMITHDLNQAQRLGNTTALLVDGCLVECQPTARFYSNPEQAVTKHYLEENWQGRGMA